MPTYYHQLTHYFQNIPANSLNFPANFISHANLCQHIFFKGQTVLTIGQGHSNNLPRNYKKRFTSVSYSSFISKLIEGLR
jgi:hypothetical protein